MAKQVKTLRLNDTVALESDVDSRLHQSSAAPVFDDTKDYPADYHVTYNGYLYRFTSAHAAGAWTGNDVVAENMTTPDAMLDLTSAGFLRVVSADGTILWMQNALSASRNEIAADFSASTAYAPPALVVYNGVLYRCSTAHPAGAWDATHFTAATVQDVLAILGNTLETVVHKTGNETIGGEKTFTGVMTTASVNALGMVLANGVTLKTDSDLSFTGTGSILMDGGLISVGSGFVMFAREASSQSPQIMMIELDSEGSPVGQYNIKLPLASGTLALTSQVDAKLNKSNGTADNLLIELGSYNNADYAVKLGLYGGTRAFYLYQRDTGGPSYSNVGTVLFPGITGATTTLASTYDLLSKLNSTSVAPLFTARAYVVHDLCTYNGNVYHCKSAYTATASSAKPDADTTHWEAKSVRDLFLPLTGGSMGQSIYFDVERGEISADTLRAILGMWLDDGVLFGFDSSTGGILQIQPSRRLTATDDVVVQIPVADGTLALAAPTVAAAGNLASLDLNGNLQDSGWTAGNLARYALSTKTITSGAVSLDDRAINSVDATSAASVVLNFPDGTIGKARDFMMVLDCGATPPTLAYGSYITIYAEDADALVPEEGRNIYMFTETSTNRFFAARKLVDKVVEQNAASPDQLMDALASAGIDTSAINTPGQMAAAVGLSESSATFGQILGKV